MSAAVVLVDPGVLAEAARVGVVCGGDVDGVFVGVAGVGEDGVVIHVAHTDVQSSGSEGGGDGAGGLHEIDGGREGGDEVIGVEEREGDGDTGERMCAVHLVVEETPAERSKTDGSVFPLASDGWRRRGGE